MIKTLVAMVLVTAVAHGVFRWAAPFVLRRVPDAPPEQKDALLRFARKKLWFGFLCGAMAALIVVTVGAPMPN